MDTRILRSIEGLTLRDKETNANIMQYCDIEGVVTWMKRRKKDWNENVDQDRKANTKIRRSIGGRPLGQLSKTWVESCFSSCVKKRGKANKKYLPVVRKRGRRS